MSLTPPVAAHVYQSSGYNVQVRNLSPNKDAQGVKLTILLPQTGTSPTVHVLGTLGAYSATCGRSGLTLTCSLGTLPRKASTSIFFELALPYSTAPIAIDAAVTTTSGDSNPGNNSVHHIASLLTYPAAFATGATAVNRHCTGAATLTSFFECELFPSSVSSHETIFDAGGTITFIATPAGYTGTWTHTPSQNRLQFDYSDGTGVVATFDGRGVDAKCFEGKTVFPGSPYVSLYEVCFP